MFITRNDLYIALDFKLILNLDKSKRVAQASYLEPLTFRCFEPPSELQRVPSTPEILYIDDRMPYAYGQKLSVTFAGKNIVQSET